jgi:hypothetical protein
MPANEKTRVDWSAQSTSLLIDARLRAGLAVLWRAYICAEDTGANVWDLSLPTARLYAAGMTEADLRWMVARGFAEHRHEATGYDEAHRSFRGSAGFSLNNRSCLILTPSGAALAEHVFGESSQSPQATLSVQARVTEETEARANPRLNVHENIKTALKPRWDAIRRELSLSGLIIKRFRVPARNQEIILSVFEEEDWVEHIHDPLPVTMDVDAPTRLHDAINRLNKCQINPLLRFHGDGKGTGIFWEICQRI